MKRSIKWCCAALSMLLAAGCGDTLQTGADTGEYSLTLTAGLSSISAGGWTEVIARIRDSSGRDYLAEDVEVTFNSTCAAQGKATIDSPVVSVAGTATSTYQAKGCVGTDTIVARADVGGAAAIGSTTVTVAAATMGAINYISALPENIGIKGVGLVETAIVTFQVLDVNGNPMANQIVDFSLNSTIGGMTLTNYESVSNQHGQVSTTVNAGDVAATVRVTASLRSNPAIKTQSDGLIISTGITTQSRFSLSASVLNPEAWNIDGQEVILTARAADHFGNRVPDGSAVYFTTEGGHIGSSCLTVDGACSVTWNSANPRPPFGRSTVLAVMQGEESFVDVNGNGRYDDGEPFDDLPEAWRDDNENGVYDLGEEYRDYDSSGVYSEADSLYSGILCVGPADCAPMRSVEVRDSLVLVMSGSEAWITIYPGGFSSCEGSVRDGLLTVSDFRGQPMPAGTTIDIEVSSGTLLTPDSYTVPSTNYNGRPTYAISWQGEEDDAVGLMTITVTSPEGLISVATASLSSSDILNCSFSPGP